VDADGDGAYGGTDTPLSGKSVYLDLNNDGVQDNSEPSTTTNSSGIYTFTDQPAGGFIRLASPTITGYVLTSPSSAAISYGATDTADFTYQAPTKLVFTQQPPATATYATTISPVIVTVETVGNYTATGDSSVVTLTLSSGTFSTGSNTATATASSGVATFSTLKINAVGSYTLTASDGSLTTALSNSFTVQKATPVLSWSAPTSITYGTALGSTQLNATASVPGTFAYTPSSGTVLSAGAGQTLSVVFTPTDTTDYTNAKRIDHDHGAEGKSHAELGKPRVDYVRNRTLQHAVECHGQCARHICLQPRSGHGADGWNQSIDRRNFHTNRFGRLQHRLGLDDYHRSEGNANRLVDPACVDSVWNGFKRHTVKRHSKRAGNICILSRERHRVDGGGQQVVERGLHADRCS